MGSCRRRGPWSSCDRCPDTRGRMGCFSFASQTPSSNTATASVLYWECSALLQYTNQVLSSVSHLMLETFFVFVYTFIGKHDWSVT